MADAVAGDDGGKVIPLGDGQRVIRLQLAPPPWNSSVLVTPPGGVEFLSRSLATSAEALAYSAALVEEHGWRVIITDLRHLGSGGAT